MKIFKFTFFALITLVLTVFLNSKYEDLPPIGKLLNPFTGFWQNGENEALEIPEEIQLTYLDQSAQVVFDDLYIPHIYANTDHDAYFLQGYLTAYHRLWQMDITVRSTAGEVSEILGENAVTFDRTQRRKGLSFAAERLLEEVKKDKKTYEMLLAFSAGVNAYIETLTYKDLPVEYKLTDARPKLWSPLKSCLIMKSMANLLSTGESDLENTNFVKVFGKELFDMIFPDSHPGIDPVVPSGTPYDFASLRTYSKDSLYPDLEINETIEKQDPLNGSNSFVVGPQKTKNGSVILSNELDLPLNIPSIWYLAHISSPTLNVMGSTIPGMPGVIVGFNDNIAWGNTNAPRDVLDWYYIEFKNDDRDEYLYDGKWLKTSKRIEEIKVAGGDTFYDTVVYTHHGPVTYDPSFLGNNEKVNFAMRWVSHDPSNEYKTVYRINRSRSYEEFVDSFNSFSGPAQSYSFASTLKEYAIWVHGTFPVKWQEQGKFLMDGRLRSHEWNQFIPKNQNIHIKDDPRGWVSSANQHPADSLYPYYIYHHRYEYYRNRRINDRLLVMQNIEPQDIMQLQNDNFNFIASENLPMMLDSLDTLSFDGRKWEYFTKLKDWDYFSEAERDAPTIFEAWQDQLRKDLWDELDDSPLALSRPTIYNSFYVLKNYAELSIIDNKSTEKKESVRDLINDSFIKALDRLETYKDESGNSSLEWYLYKNTTVKHLANLDPFSFDKIKVGGNHNIVNAASGRNGPSWRMVVELNEAGVKAWGVYPGSQTGNPGNPQWGHLIEDWANGVYSELYFGDRENMDPEKISRTINFVK